jgi:hypothetical protein
MTYINEPVDLTSLIQQAIDNGDTATARALSRALENQTRISTVIQEPTEYVEYQQPSAYVRSSPNNGVSVTWWLCFVILPYLAIAEVLTPGHQGPLKIYKTYLAWPISLVSSVTKSFGGNDNAAP